MVPLHQKIRLIALALLPLLAGCAPQSGESLWQDYLRRLERLTGLEASPATPARRAPYPRHRDLQLPVAEQRTGLLRYFNLLDCDLMELVSERNSVLGRVQRDSLRLDYELRFIDGGRSCLEDGRLNEDQEMASWLSDLIAEKTADLPRRGWNLSFAGPELAGYFRQRPVPAATPVPEEWPSTVEALATLARLSRELDQTPPAQLDAAVERALETLDKSSAGGQMLDALALARQQLERAAALLEQVDTARLCPHGKPGQRARYLNNVFHQIYAARLQPWLADLSRAARPIAAASMALRAAQQAPEHPVLDFWLAGQLGEQGLLASYNKALMQHSRAWQRVLGDCKLMPDVSNRTRMFTD